MTNYNLLYRIPDSPEEPDQMEIVPYSEPLNIPLEDMSGDTAPIYNYVSEPWPEPKGDQPPNIEYPIAINNNIMPMPNMMIPQPQFPVFGGNQMNWGMTPENIMGMGPPPNNMYIPPNQMIMNNQQMFMGDQMQPQPLQSQQPQQPSQQHHAPPMQEDQWMGPPGPQMQHDQHQHWGQQQPPQNNGPPHFERGGGRGHSRWDNSRGSNYDSYRGKMNRGNRGNRGGPFNRRGGPGNGRVGGRLCKYYAKQGFCKISNCVFLHSKS